MLKNIWGTVAPFNENALGKGSKLHHWVDAQHITVQEFEKLDLNAIEENLKAGMYGLLPAPLAPAEPLKSDWTMQVLMGKDPAKDGQVLVLRYFECKSNWPVYSTIKKISKESLTYS